MVGHHHVAAVLQKFPEEEMGGLLGLMMRTRSLRLERKEKSLLWKKD